MSSDLFVFDGYLYQHSGSEKASSDTELQFFSDPFSPLSDSNFDLFQQISDELNQENPVDNSHSLDQISHNLISPSPPNHQMENLSLCQTTHLQPFMNSSNSANGFADFSGFGGLEVKTEQCHLGFVPFFDPSFIPNSYSVSENAAKIMQRTYSSNSFDGKPGFFFQPCLNTLMDTPNFQTHLINSPENGFPTSQMRRVYSTGDLQNIPPPRTTQRSFSNPLATENSFIEEPSFKVGRYSAEERKERIDRYRAKRTQRNFNKTIKYACRKTLADNRPRIRGRFARNDETGEIPKGACSIKDEDEEQLWIAAGTNDENFEGTVRGGGAFLISSGSNQFQYYGF